MLCQTLEHGQVGVQSLLCRLRLWYNAVDASVDSLSIGELLLFLDALCRDGTSEISRDPRTKCLQTRRESLARPSKHTNNNF